MSTPEPAPSARSNRTSTTHPDVTPSPDAGGTSTGNGAIGIAPWLVALALFFALVAIAAIVVGVHDVSLASAGLGVNLTGAALLAVAAASLVAAYELVRMSRRGRWADGVRPPCKPAVLVALLLVLLLGFYAFLSGIRGLGDQRVVVVAIAGLLIGVAVVGLVAFGSEARVTFPRVGAIALAVIGTAVSAWQFWYQNEYAPSQAGRSVVLRAELARETRQPSTDVIRAR